MQAKFKSASLLFVCLGNICRSPVAEAVCRQYTTSLGFPIHCDSAGLHELHKGEPPDFRTRKNAAQHNLDLTGIQSRNITPADWQHADMILAMDNRVYNTLKAQCPSATALKKLHAFMAFNPESAIAEVPDPYYGTDADFEIVYQLCVSTIPHIIQKLNSATVLIP